tara:strand:- start:171 stop:1118 length:948 start_codon:yes stop_codon:yes gene_type:complete
MEHLNITPIIQTKLFNHDATFLELIKIYKENKLPNKIILSGKNGIGKSTTAYHFINYIFSKDEEFKYNLDKFEINNSNKSFNLVKNNSHPNLCSISLQEDKNSIEISQIREMYNFVNKSSFNNKERIILIDNVESLNNHSSNALLKIIEEPNEKVIFILIHDNRKKLIETLNSRCLKFNFFLSFDNTIKTANKILNHNVLDNINNDLINNYESVGDILNLYKSSIELKIDLSNMNLRNFLIKIIDNKYYKKNNFIKSNVFNFIEFYFIKLLKNNNSEKQIYLFYDRFIKKIFYLKKFNLDQESLFIEFKRKFLNG